MPAPAFLSKLPKPALFALYGALGGLVGALVLGEPVWYLLRPAPPPEAVAAPIPLPPPPQLAVTASPQVSVYPGGSNTFGVQIIRDRFTGPVTVTFDNLAPGLSAANIVIPEDETSGIAQLVATANTRPGTSTLLATADATADGHAIAATLATPVEVRVLAPPPPAPRLAVSVSPKIQVYPRGKNTFTVQVARDRFAGEVEVAFEDLPDGVKVASVVFPPERSEMTVELTADATARPGSQEVKVSVRAKLNGAPLQARTATTVDVLSPSRVPLDVVFALGISGNMQWAINGTSGGIQKFADELGKAQFDVRVGLVGFKDTTLGQPLAVVTVDGDRMTANFARFRDAVGRLRARGGGAEGESSLDGIAKAAESPFRDQVTRVVVLITDEGPKRPDGKMKSIEDTAKYIKDKKIDQMHVVTLPELKKPYTPLWEGAKGTYFDLKSLNENAENLEKLLPEVSKAIAELVPERPVGKPELPAPASAPQLPEARAAVAGAPPPAPEPETPSIAPLHVKCLPFDDQPAGGTVWRHAARGGLWASVSAALVCAALLAGWKNYLRGPLPLGGVLVVLGGGLLVALVIGAAGYGLSLTDTDDKVPGALLRVPGWALLGGLAGAGLSLFIPNLSAPVRTGDALELEPLPLPDPEPEPAVAPRKPNIAAAPKPGEGCPGCGRKIPGETGSRYCMLCDATF